MNDLSRTLVASAPTRLDFGGGWTDVPPFPEERGGCVCNVAINRRATVHLTPSSVDVSPTDRLVGAAVRRAGASHLHIRIHSDFPIGAGLGGSSAAGVALSAALHEWRNQSVEAVGLADWSRAVEVDELGIAGGRQDHYAAAFGGALALYFTAVTEVERLPLSPLTRTALEHQCVLAYTGESRISATTISAVLDAYRTRSPRVVSALDRMAQLARLMRDALLLGSIDEVGRLVNEHWVHQRSLHASITTPRIDAIHAVAFAAGAIGMKALGASGGGCVIVFAPDDRVREVSRAVATLAAVLPWQIDDLGAVVAPATSLQQ